jgi:predicted outer membrane repeat protein
VGLDHLTIFLHAAALSNNDPSSRLSIHTSLPPSSPMRFGNILFLALSLCGYLLPTPSSSPFASALNATLYVTPLSPDSAPMPQNCPSDDPSPGSCNLRSAITACSSYLISSTNWCSIILPSGDLILLDPYLGDLQMGGIGALVIIGNQATIAPLPNGTTPFRFLTMTQRNLQYLSVNISKISFHNFSSGATGGVFRFQSLDFVSLRFLTFLNNSAISGGAIFVDGCAAIEIAFCTFALNSAEDGGALQFDSNNHNLLVTHSHFFGNIATSPSSSDRNQGGAIFFNTLNSLVEISQCSFEANEAINGGAVYFHSENRLVSISSCVFEMNHASFGGAIMLYNSNSEVTVIDTLLDSNTALQFYGFRSPALPSIALTASPLLSSISIGGGMFIYSSNVDTLLQNVTFLRNSAFYGCSSFPPSLHTLTSLPTPTPLSLPQEELSMLTVTTQT